ncbi:MAG TPA: PqqD family protein [Acholeplasma sp.]|nr:PqqD family protein [Acholeplasma sp.]
MKIKDGYILRQVNNEWIVVTVGQAAINFSGLIRLNETGAFLFDLMLKETNIDTLVKELTNEFEISEEIALRDVKKFIETLKVKKILDETN